MLRSLHECGTVACIRTFFKPAVSPRTPVTHTVTARCTPYGHTDCAEFGAFPERQARLLRLRFAISARVAPAPEAAQWRGTTGELAGLDPVLLAHPN